MNLFRRTTTIDRMSAVLALVSIFFTAAPRAKAKRREGNSSPGPGVVLAHLQIPGASASQLVLNLQGAKQYLYLEQGSEGFAVVDVTQPSQPSVVKRRALANEASTRELHMIGPRLALADAQNDATSEPVHGSTLLLLDLSDPASPRNIQTFTGVTSILSDGARGLTYIADRDGLWILKVAEPAAADELRACSSDDASNEVASCE